MGFIQAKATATPRGSGGQFIAARITPAIKAAVQVASQAVLEAAQAIVPVDTGELRDSGSVVVEETDKTVVGRIVFSSDHAGYVEFGTGIRGASSPGAGPYPYSPNWHGMPARPYLRPALDSTRDSVREIFASQIALAMKY